MEKIPQALALAINEHPNKPVVIAYSGGVDSQVLLHAISSLKHSSTISNPITVCHVNHGLSINAQQWQLFAQQACLKVNLPLKICQVNVQEKPQHSLEALARDARYQALQSIYTQGSLIVTGHHKDDQAETFLLALKRGSGLKGLSAMAQERTFNKDLLVRPLLAFTRAYIVNYAKQHQLSWVEDESNSDTRYDRNFIRNDVMPILTERWPSLVNSIYRTSEHCQEGQLLLDELAIEDLERCQNKLSQFSSASLLVSALLHLSAARFKNLIRYFLAQHQCLMPSGEQLTQLLVQLKAGHDKNPEVKVGEHFFRRYKDALYLTKNFDDISSWQTDVELFSQDSWLDKRLIELPNHLGTLKFAVMPSSVSSQAQNSTLDNAQYIKAPSSNQQVTIRFAHHNPVCLPDYRNHSRALKKILQELNIPPWQRKRIPFLYYDEVLVGAVGYFICQEFVASPNDAKVVVSWQQ